MASPSPPNSSRSSSRSPSDRGSSPSASGIYLDHHATTPLDERVLGAMQPFLEAEFGNAASHTHAYGWRAEAAVDLAREQLADLLGASSPREIIFTSGATESNNLALLGSADACSTPGHVLTAVTEHPSVLDSCRSLVRRGWRVTELPVDSEGMISPSSFVAALRPETKIASVMAANNEIGVLQPIAELAAHCAERGIAFHTDAAQAAGKIELNVAREGLDLVSVSGHKIYGPKGIGLLRVRKEGQSRPRLEPRQYGGGHEGGLRSGTLPVAGIVGLAKALELCLAERVEEGKRLRGLRDQLWEALREGFPGGLRLNGHAEQRLPGNLNVSFDEIDGDRLLADLGGLAVSSGSACSSAKPEPSHVLLALGHSKALARASLRFGFGRGNTQQDVTAAAGRIVTALRRQIP